MSQPVRSNPLFLLVGDFFFFLSTWLQSRKKRRKVLENVIFGERGKGGKWQRTTGRTHGKWGGETLGRHPASGNGGGRARLWNEMAPWVCLWSEANERVQMKRCSRVHMLQRDGAGGDGLACTASASPPFFWVPVEPPSRYWSDMIVSRSFFVIVCPTVCV